jgi:hypothetical protein
MAASIGNTAASRSRSAAQADMAAELIDNMRHILWSLNHAEAGPTELAGYLRDRARALAGASDRRVVVEETGPWPVSGTSHDMRHQVWPVLKDALRTMFRMRGDVIPELRLSWREGVFVSLMCRGEADKELRAALATALARHQLSIAGLGGSSRVSTEGDVGLELLIPLPVNVHTGTPLSTVLLLLLPLWFTAAVPGPRPTTQGRIRAPPGVGRGDRSGSGSVPHVARFAAGGKLGAGEGP